MPAWRRGCVRFSQASIARSRHDRSEGRPDSQPLIVVDVREIDPPDGDAIHWRLLTTLAVDDVAQAFDVVDLYQRWAIEQLFRSLKTQGFDIENLLVEDEAAVQRRLMAALIAAVTTQQLVHARDGQQGPTPLRPLTDAFDSTDSALLEAFCKKLEGKTQRQKTPHPKGSLAYAAWVCARLGGWTGYYGKLGPIVMGQGWMEFQAARRGLELIANPHIV